MTIILNLKSVQCKIIKELFESLKNVMKECNIIFSKDYIKIYHLDKKTKSVLTFVELKTEKLELYELLQEKLVLGVNIDKIFKVLKTIGVNDTICFIYDINSPDFLEIRMENLQNSYIRKIKLSLLKLDEHIYEIPDIEYDNIVSISSSEFQKICKDFDSLDGEKIEIKSTSKHLFFLCREGIAHSNEIIISEIKNLEIDLPSKQKGATFKKSFNSITQGVYRLSSLKDFSKSSNLCNEVNLYLKNDQPLIVEYGIANLGVLRFIIYSIN
jgi:proliferating cell nuclear antigen